VKTVRKGERKKEFLQGKRGQEKIGRRYYPSSGESAWGFAGEKRGRFEKPSKSVKEGGHLRARPTLRHQMAMNY